MCDNGKNLLMAISLVKTVHFSIKWNGININYCGFDKYRGMSNGFPCTSGTRLRVCCNICLNRITDSGRGS